MPELIYMAITAAAGAAAGTIKAILGFFANAQSWKDFNSFKFFRTIVINAGFGAISGALTDNISTAIVAGLLGEQTVKTVIKRSYLRKNGGSNGI